MREFCRTFRIGSKSCIVQRGENNHGRFMELLEYSGGGWRSFIISSKGQEGSGGQLRLSDEVGGEIYFEQKGVVGNRNGCLVLIRGCH